MGRGPQPFEPPGRGGVTFGKIAALGAGVTVAFGATEAVLFASSWAKAVLDDDTCAETLMPNPSENTKANPKPREIDINHTPAWMEHSLSYRYVFLAKGHIKSYRQIYSKVPQFVKTMTFAIVECVDFIPHASAVRNLTFLRTGLFLSYVTAGLVRVRSISWFILRLDIADGHFALIC